MPVACGDTTRDRGSPHDLTRRSRRKRATARPDL